MNRKTQWIATAAVAVVALGGATGIAVASGGDDDASDTPISGEPLAQASAAALKHTGGGTVTGTEEGDEEGAYEVEVKKTDGSTVDVHLDKDFNVINSKADGGGEDAGNGESENG